MRNRSRANVIAAWVTTWISTHRNSGMNFKIFLINMKSIAKERGITNKSNAQIIIKTTIEMKWIRLENWQLSHGLVVSTREGLSTQPGDYPVPTVPPWIQMWPLRSFRGLPLTRAELKNGSAVREDRRTCRFMNHHAHLKTQLNHNTVVWLNNTST